MVRIRRDGSIHRAPPQGDQPGDESHRVFEDVVAPEHRADLLGPRAHRGDPVILAPGDVALAPVPPDGELRGAQQGPRARRGRHLRAELPIPQRLRSLAAPPFASPRRRAHHRVRRDPERPEDRERDPTQHQRRLVLDLLPPSSRHQRPRDRSRWAPARAQGQVERKRAQREAPLPATAAPVAAVRGGLDRYRPSRPHAPPHARS
mmetsp:Transcript_1242/g.5511  ORF Transcript_1242/g.5511 Transcript_1242/m.5511 type:complete len:205 (-) Transcript_1242:20-634(-)